MSISVICVHFISEQINVLQLIAQIPDASAYIRSLKFILTATVQHALPPEPALLQ